MNSNERRNLTFFMTGRFVSWVGSGIQMVAMPLYILDITGSGVLMGLFAMLSMVPALAIAPLSGVLGDRWNRKHIMVYTDFARGILVYFLAVLALTGKLSIAALFISQAAISTLDSMFNSSSDGIIPDLVSHDALPRANAIQGGSDSLSMIIGPVIGGVMYGIWGIQTVFFLNATSFVFSGLSEVLIVYRRHEKDREKLSVKVFFHEFREVMEFVIRHNGLKQLFVFTMALNFLLVPVFFVIMPFTLKKVIGFSSHQYGYLQAIFMTGLLLGNILTGAFFTRTNARRLMKTGLFLQNGVLVFFALILFPHTVYHLGGASWTYFGILGITICSIGIFNPAVNIPIRTNLQKMVGSEIRSRFFAIVGMMTQLVAPVGSVIYGILLDKVAVSTIMLSISIVVFGITILFLLVAPNEAYEPHLISDSDP